MCRYATREEDLDRLLRAGVFVDLYRAVRQGLRLSAESYSIKSLEAFYGYRRSDPITGRSAALIEYERYLQTDDDSILADLATYNRADCESMVYLRDWLEERRAEAEELFGRRLARPAFGEPEPEANLSETLQRVAALVDALTADIPIEHEGRSPEQKARWLLAQLLGWHRREDKSQWWAYYDRRGKSPEELIDDHECLGDMSYDGVEGEGKLSNVLRFRFPRQEHKVTTGDYLDPQTGSGVKVVEVDDDDRCVLIKRSKDRTDHPRAIMPSGPYRKNEQRAALERLAEWVIANGIDSDQGTYRATRDLLLRRPPRVSGIAAGSELQAPGESGRDSACRIAPRLEDSYLPIQGPPGTGKTYTGAHMIVTLVEAGHKVGITATSHRVISNLLNEACDVASERGAKIKALQKCDSGDDCGRDEVTVRGTNSQFDDDWATGDFDVAAGTAWLLSRPELEGSLHTLFIDEAGQFSLADAAAVAGAARNLVLLGDPQQLAQPSQGVHPPGAEASVLEHVLEDQDIIRPHQGLFLERTRRMHPSICRFISRASYEGHLEPAEGRELQELSDAGDLSGAGVHFVEVDHHDNRVTSQEECDEIVEMLDRLSGATWTNAEGAVAALGLEDILVVAPYNRQVALLRRRLPAGAPVGTVDKFQGQQGVVTFYSMTTSDPEDVPHTFEFLYSLNRLNVAVSRAKAVAVVVGSPALLRTRCKTPRQMRLINALCLLHETANSRERSGTGIS